MTTQEFVSPRDALDIVFANRNRAYGAYQLRRAYSRHLARALGIGLLLIGFGIVLPQILRAVSPEPIEKIVEGEFMPGPPPDIDPELPPPPPPPPTPKPPAKSVIKFVPQTPTPDEEVTEEKQRTQEEVLVAAANVGTNDHKSEGDGPPTLNDVPDFPREIETAAKPDNSEYLPYGLQKAPAFPGGDQELLKYLAENIKYPPMARENNIQGTVVLSFLIGKDGKVSDVSVLNEIGGGCGKEALRVVKAMPPWIPGEANGHAVKVRYSLPVRFRLQ